MSVALILLPVVFIVALGAALARGGFLSQDLIRGLNRVAYWVGLPCLIFGTLAGMEPDAVLPWKAIGIFAAATLLAAVLAWFWILLARLPRAKVGTFVQASMRGNLAFIGLPIAVNYFEIVGIEFGETGFSSTMLIIAAMMLLYNIVAVPLFLFSQGGHSSGDSSFREKCQQVVANPLILSTLAGMVFWGFGGTLPGFLERTLTSLGQMALPLALLSIGGVVATLNPRGAVRDAVAASVIKILALPALVFVLGTIFQLEWEAFSILMIMAATPTAAVSYTLATQMRGDSALAAGAIMISTVTAWVPLLVVLSLLISLS